MVAIRKRDGKWHEELARVGWQLGAHAEALRSWVKRRIGELEREVYEFGRANGMLQA